MPPLKKHLYLIDGSGFIFRAFHALPPLTRPDGTPVGAVYGFTNMLIKLLERAASDADLDYIAVIFDAARKTFRNDIYPEYKAHRPDTPPDLIPQFALVRDATRACNVPAIELPNFEADDLIASYASKAVAGGMDVTVVTGDKDMMQLVGDGIKLFDPIKNKPITETDVMEKFGVPPNRVIDVQSLAGDSSDNVPGVPGIGVKTAAELINQYGDLESLLARAGEIKQPKRREALINHADDARISKQLVTLKNDVELPMPIDDLIARPIDADMMRNFLAAQGFKTMLAKFGNAASPSTNSPSTLIPSRHEEPYRGTPPIAHRPPSTDHRLIQTESQLTEWLNAMPPFGEIAVDVETDSLAAVSANLVGISLARAPGVACYIPVGHRAADAGLDFTGSNNAAIVQLSIDVVRRHLAPVLQNPAIIKIGHNLKFDRQVMIRYGLDFAPHRDTMLMSYVLDGGKHGHGMDELAKLHLGHDTIKFHDVVGKGKHQITFDLVPLDRAMQYAAEDADITLRLYHALYPRLAAESCQTIFDVIENPLTPVVADMESAGVLVDRRGLHDLSLEFEKKLLELQHQIHAAAGMEFNIASPKQMGEVLFEKLKLPGGGKTKTGAWSTDVEVLENLDAAGHAIAGQILAWRQLAKLKSTYTDTLIEQINPKTGRVHTSFHMALTNTGRFSSSDPNLQNIPIRTVEGKKIRAAFIAAPNCQLLSADYSQIELRLMAEMAGIPALRAAFADGIDIHALTASEVFRTPIADVSPDLRRSAKAINFGIIYGISAFGLAKQLGCSNSEAKQFIDHYFARFPEIRDFMESQKEFARANGYVLTLFGRKCFMPEINAKNGALRAFAERQAINAPLQGTAADIIKRAMIKMPPAMRAGNLTGKMILQVHDELLFEIPSAEAEASAQVVCEVMQSAAAPAVKLSVPLVVDVTIADRWG